MSLNAHLESLRELLYARPSRWDWDALVRLLERWRQDSPQTLEQGLNYACDHLDDAWPDAWRRVEVRDPHKLATALSRASWPLVRPLSVFECTAEARVPERLVQTKALASITRLELSCRQPEPRLGALWRSPDLGSLTQLVLRGAVGSRDAIEAMEAASMPALEMLDLYSNARLGDGGVLCLLAAPASRGLTSLDLGRCGVGSGCMIGFSDYGPHHLKRLSMRGNRLTDTDAGLLARGLATRRLEELDLSHNNMTVVGLEALLGPNALPSIRRLGFAGHGVSQREVQRILGRRPDASNVRVVLD